MMPEPAAIQPMFCRRCTYPLDVGVEAQRCPECGRPYDPADPRSYLGSAEVVIAGPTARLVRSPILWLFALMPFAVLLDRVLMTRSGVLLFSTMLVGLCSMIWCVQDSQRRGFRMSTLLMITVFLMPVIMLPVYLFRARVRRAALVAIIALLLMAAAALVASASVATAAALGIV